MSEIITAIYDTTTSVTNVVDDLVSTGIPRDKIRVEEEKRQVQVLTPETTRPEITEILNRHQPLELRTTENPE